MLKKYLKTLPVFFLLFLIFCFSLFPLSANACNCMCSFSGGAEQYVGAASNNNCSYFWCDASKGLSGSPHCATDSTQQSGPVQFVPQIPIPGYTFDASDSSTRNIANYVKAIYKYLIGIVGIVAAITLMVGGVVWLTAGGSPERVKQAQDYIVGSLTGLVLALGSFLILGMINPALVNFRISGIGTVANVGIDSNKKLQENLDEAAKQCPNGNPIGNIIGANCATVCPDGVESSNTFTISGSEFLCCVCKNISGPCFDNIGGNPINKPDGTSCLKLDGKNGICKDGQCIKDPNCGQPNKFCGQNISSLNPAEAECCSKCCNGGCKAGGGVFGVFQAVCK